jgi:hypothetical protein
VVICYSSSQKLIYIPCYVVEIYLAENREPQRVCDLLVDGSIFKEYIWDGLLSGSE